MEHFIAYFSNLIHLKMRSRLRSPQAVEDVRQETFARVLLALRDDKIRQPERLGSYVNSVCNNVYLESCHSSHHDSYLDDDENQDFPDVRIDIVGTLAAKQTKEKVRQILDELPEKERWLLYQICLMERDRDEVCRELDITRDNLRLRLHRAKQLFKSRYMDS